MVVSLGAKGGPWGAEFRCFGEIFEMDYEIFAVRWWAKYILLRTGDRNMIQTSNT